MPRTRFENANLLDGVHAARPGVRVVVDGDPSIDITTLTDSTHLKAILKAGVFVKDELPQ